MQLLTRSRTLIAVAAAILGALWLSPQAAQAQVRPASQTFTIGGVSCTLHSESIGTYNSMYCSTSQSYHFTSQACRTSCTTLSSDTLANNRLVHICAPANTGLGNVLTVYFGSTNKGAYTVARNSISPVPC